MACRGLGAINFEVDFCFVIGSGRNRIARMQRRVIRYPATERPCRLMSALVISGQTRAWLFCLLSAKTCRSAKAHTALVAEPLLSQIGTTTSAPRAMLLSRSSALSKFTIQATFSCAKPCREP